MTFDRIDWTALAEKLTALRREFHRYPEAGWTEFRTTDRIIEELEKLELPVRYGPEIHVREKMFGLPKDEVMEACLARAVKEGGRKNVIERMRGGYTGCITEICGALPGPTVGIRVDIDCNEVDEASSETHRPFREGFFSLHPGLMHACGHDAHTVIGIGTAMVLTAYRDLLPGKVILVFQPGEEGLRGAASLTAAGHFSGCDYFFGGHVGLFKGLEVGAVVASGHNFLSSTKLDVTYHGVPSHAGASPELGRNALAAAACAVLNLLAISRHSEGASRINIGTLKGGTGRNVIPEYAEMTLETRGGTSEINEFMEAEARRVIKAAADMYGVDHEIRYVGGAGDVVCDPALVDRTMEILASVDGVREIIRDHYFGGGEDVTTMMRDVQAHGGQVTELVFGMPLTAPHHNGFFDVKEEVIPLAVRIFSSLAMEVSGS